MRNHFPSHLPTFQSPCLPSYWSSFNMFVARAAPWLPAEWTQHPRLTRMSRTHTNGEENQQNRRQTKSSHFVSESQISESLGISCVDLASLKYHHSAHRSFALHTKAAHKNSLPLQIISLVQTITLDLLVLSAGCFCSKSMKHQRVELGLFLMQSRYRAYTDRKLSCVVL